MASQVFEFPYSGYTAPVFPYANYNSGGLSPYNISSLDNLIHDQSAVYNVPDSRQLFQNLGNDAIVYKVPDDISLDTLLRELGVDVNSLQRASPYSNHFISDGNVRVLYFEGAALPMGHMLPPYRRSRRRRLVCHEISDSEDDDYSSQDSSSYHGGRHRRRHHHHSVNKYNQSPARVHSLLNNAWGNAVRATQNSPPPQQSTPNINSQWQNAPPVSPEHRDAVAHVWGQATDATKDKPNFLSSFFNRMKSTPESQQNSTAVRNFAAGNNFSSGMNQSNNPVANVFNAAQRGSPPPPPPSAVNNAWNQMSGGAPPRPPMGSMWNQMSRASPPLPPQQPYNAPRPPMGSMWNQMSGAAPPPPPSSAVNNAWNQMSGGPAPRPPMGSIWNQMSAASTPPQQPYYPPRPPMGSMWNQMSGASPPPLQQSYPSYGPPSMGGPQQGYPSPAASNAFAAMFSQPRA